MFISSCKTSTNQKKERKENWNERQNVNRHEAASNLPSELNDFTKWSEKRSKIISILLYSKYLLRLSRCHSPLHHNMEMENIALEVQQRTTYFIYVLKYICKFWLTLLIVEADHFIFPFTQLPLTNIRVPINNVLFKGQLSINNVY